MTPRFLAFLALLAFAIAAVPSSPRFQLTAGSADLFRHKKLKGVTVQQSFAYDNDNRRVSHSLET